MGTHDDTVISLFLSYEGNLLFSGSRDGVIKIWDIRRNKEIGIMGNHDDAVSSLCLSSHRNILYSGNFDNKIKMWDVNKHYSNFWDKFYFNFLVDDESNEEKFIEQLEYFKQKLINYILKNFLILFLFVLIKILKKPYIS